MSDEEIVSNDQVKAEGEAQGATEASQATDAAAAATSIPAQAQVDAAPATPEAVQASPVQGAAPTTDAHGGHDAPKKGPTLQERIKSGIYSFKSYLTRPDSVFSAIPRVFESLFSFDQPTRRMSLLFVMSLLGVVLVTGVAADRFLTKRKAAKLLEAKQAALKLKEQELLQAEESKRRVNTVSLGSFTLELKPLKGTQPSGRGVGVVDMAEVELILLCDSEETCTHISHQKVQAKNQITQVFTPIDREELLSKEGKRRVKSALLKKLNGWIPHGKVNDVYFSKLVVH